VLIGGTGPTVIDRVLAFGDAWFPNYAPEGVLDRADELRPGLSARSTSMIMGAPADPKAIERVYDSRRAGSSTGSRPAACPRWKRRARTLEAAIAEFTGEG